jgi:hypothetical protein
MTMPIQHPHAGDSPHSSGLGCSRPQLFRLLVPGHGVTGRTAGEKDRAPGDEIRIVPGFSRCNHAAHPILQRPGDHCVRLHLRGEADAGGGHRFRNANLGFLAKSVVCEHPARSSREGAGGAGDHPCCFVDEVDRHRLSTTVDVGRGHESVGGLARRVRIKRVVPF